MLQNASHSPIPAPRPAGGRRGRPRRLAALLVLGIVALAGCSGGGGPSGQPQVTLPTLNPPTINVTVNPPTLPAGPTVTVTRKSETAAAKQDAKTEGLPTWLWIVLAGAVVAAIVAAISSARRRKAYTDALVTDVVSRGNWVVDHGTDALVGAADGAGTQQAWSSLDGALVDLAADVTKLQGRLGGERATQLLEIRDAVAALRLAAESMAQSKLSGSPGQSAAPATDALFAARRRLASAIAVFDPDAPPPATGQPAP